MASIHLLSLLTILGFAALIYYVKKQGRTAASRQGKLREYEKSQAIGAIIGPILNGVIFIGVILVSWNSIPPGNEPIIYFMFGIAALFLIYGLYKWYRFKQQQEKSR